jgi:hypothetical protein
MWKPASPPRGFLLEQSPVPPEFIAIAHTVLNKDTSSQSNWDRALHIARHLAQGPGIGTGIQSNTLDTYRTIMTKKQGWCSDYTQVFNGIAIAAGIPVREWGMSFDGFSGRGHAFNEVYDDRLGKWIFIDSFFSFYVKDARTGIPLSAMEFRKRLQAEEGPQKNLVVEPIEPRRLRSAAQVLEFYKRGADQFYLWFGNNVFSYDAYPLVRALGPWSKVLEQGAAIIAGVHPKIRIIETESNRELIDALFSRRNLFMLGVFVLVVLGLGLLLELRTYRRALAYDSRSGGASQLKAE